MLAANYTLTFTGPINVNEGDMSATFQVSIDQVVQPGDGKVVCTCWTIDNTAITPDDYTNTYVDLTWNVGQGGNKFISVPIINDSIYETAEALFVKFNAIINTGGGTITYAGLDGSNQGTINIADDDTYNVTIDGPHSIDENSGTLAFNISLDQDAPIGGADIIFALTNGTATEANDFSYNTSSPLNIPQGSNSVSIIINIVDDNIREDNEAFTVNLTANAGQVLVGSPATCNIINDDEYLISIDDQTVIEGGTAGFTVSLHQPVLAGQSVTLTYQTNPDSADNNVDYTGHGATLLTFNPGEQNKTINIISLDDNLVENQEHYSIVLSLPSANASISDDTGDAYINDDGDQYLISIDDQTVIEGGTAGFTISLHQVVLATQTVTVQYTTTNGSATAGSDYTATSGTLTFNATENSRSVTVDTTNDSDFEADETFNLNLNTASANAAIIDTDGLCTLTNNDYRLTVNLSGTGQITSAPAGIDCPGDCTQDYTTGTVVTLTATETDGAWFFEEWTGDATEISSPVNITVDSNRSVNAIFSKKPVILLNPVTLTAARTINCNEADSLTFTITNDNAALGSPGPLRYIVSDNEGWLSCSPSSGDLEPGISETITVTFDSAALAAGIHNAIITVTDSNASNNPQTIDVALEANSEPVISLDPTTLTPEVTEGQDATTQTFTITNNNSTATLPAVLNYSISDSATWLSVSPATGSLASADSDTITIIYDTTALAAGTYTAAINISDPCASNTPQPITVILTVHGAPVISLDPAFLNGIINQGNDATATTFTIENTGDHTLFTAMNYTITDDSVGGWISISPTSGTLNPGSSGAINVTFSTSALPAGLHRATITVSDPNALNNPQIINVAIGITGEEEVSISGSSDDAEERTDDHGMYLNSSDLELIEDDSENQIVGIRFQNIRVPPNAVITNAYIEFETDETDSEATSLTIYGEDTDDASTFTSSHSNISNRTKTAASVNWNNLTAWDQVGQKHQTPDLKTIVQEIVNRANWAQNNAMAFIITGSGERTAESYDGNGTPPRLHIKYLPGTFAIIAVNPTSLTPRNFQGNNANTETFILSNTGSIETLNFTITDNESWLSCSPTTGSLGSGLSATITVTYDTDALAIGSYTNIITITDPFSPNSPLDLDVTLTVLESEPIIDVDKTYIGATSYQGNNATDNSFTLSNTGSAQLNYTITDNVDWLSCTPDTGSVNPDSSVSIAVNFSNDTMAPGIYNTDIVITDANASNSPVEINVSLTIEAIPVSSNCGDVPIYTENLVSPAIIILLDVSGSMSSLMTISDEEENPKTPDLSSIIQEIVDNGGWKPGYSMAFIISGSGHRTAESYDGSSASAPLLHVEYDGNEVNVRVSESMDDVEEKVSNGNIYSNSSDLELINDGSDQIIGIRFQDIPIPKNANITNAYIEFVIDENQSEATSLTIRGHDSNNAPQFTAQNNNVSNRNVTTASVSWNSSSIPPLEAWDSAITQQSRVDIGKDVISELVTDRSISWGFGSWCFEYSGSADYDGTDLSNENYTKIHVGSKLHDDAHQTDLQNAISTITALGGTPLGPSLIAGRKYFQGNKLDEVGTGEAFVELGCQPKFILEVTDGLGYSPHTTVSLVEEYTNDLYDANISVIAVGFGIDNAEQIQKIAEISNQRGNANLNDELYALHEEDAGGSGLPFIAQSKQALIDALQTITSRIASEIFHGSAPAPTTSIDYGDIVITALFDPTDWSGDLVAKTYDTDTGTVNETPLWRASEEMPATGNINGFTIGGPLTNVGDTGEIIEYSNATFPNDNFLCKDLGDIINSTPIIVESPPFNYNFDSYLSNFRLNADLLAREPMVYIGANDGALHAFLLSDITDEDGNILTNGGTERWRFYPEGIHETLNSANDPSYNMCDDAYCHKYTVDGSPIVGDIFDKSVSPTLWKTILISGLREGGESYFALDITYSKSFDATENPSVFLWELTDNELGQTWAEPSICRVQDGVGTEWAAFMSSGYSTTDQANKAAFLYGVVASTGEGLWDDGLGNVTNRVKIHNYGYLNFTAHNPHSFEVGDMLKGAPSGAEGTVAEIAYGPSNTAIVLLTDIKGEWLHNDNIINQGGGAGFVDGTLYGGMPDNALSSPLLIDFNGNYVNENIYVGDLYGKFYRISNIGKDEIPTVTTLYESFNASHTNPIRAKADYAIAEESNTIWAFFGTGKYGDQSDKTSLVKQHFFGLKENLTSITTYSLDANGYPVNSSNEKGISLTAGFVTDANSGITYRVIQRDTSYTPDIDSWVVSLNNTEPAGNLLGSERVISQPLVVAGVVFFTTFTPDNNVCAGNGDAWLYAVDYATGLPPDEAVFDINGDGQIDSQDMITDSEGNQHSISGISLGSGMPSKPVLHKDTLFITTTGGGLSPVKVNLPGMNASLTSWKDLAF